MGRGRVRYVLRNRFLFYLIQRRLFTEACDKVTYQYLQEHRRIDTPTPFDTTARRSISRDRSPSIEELSDTGPNNTHPSTKQDAEDDGGDDSQSQAFHLLVRSAKTKDNDITLLVRPTTKCGAIVRAFLKKAGLEAEYPSVDGEPKKVGRGRGKTATKVPALSVDGDKMNPETAIGEADLEEGDMVEVVDL